MSKIDDGGPAAVCSDPNGPWQVVENKGEFGWPPGFYVYRDISTPAGQAVEWMKQRGGIRPFRSEDAAKTGIALTMLAELAKAQA